MTKRVGEGESPATNPVKGGLERNGIEGTGDGGSADRSNRVEPRETSRPYGSGACFRGVEGFFMLSFGGGME
ncbi:hypothetical protein GCM10007416_06490 [Kroppenstedtia guangzhouensis]|uniref:Uncharacterized protein n=1 Tax=Kroppenstedtia guangzhouensis TaxID=1274356 RepID=A0ABQ1G4Q8_9BACL|nr:hypothetical protein [Kroppenstedtia guangzhouensis]GGA36305.1 hypothetical protein GCM10007416_06490 [Kroppenstedtia guangzhouensis]